MIWFEWLDISATLWDNGKKVWTKGRWQYNPRNVSKILLGQVMKVANSKPRDVGNDVKLNIGWQIRPGNKNHPHVCTGDDSDDVSGILWTMNRNDMVRSFKRKMQPTKIDQNSSLKKRRLFSRAKNLKWLSKKRYSDEEHCIFYFLLPTLLNICLARAH